jgi:hypothetical protein
MPIPVICSCAAKLKVGDHLKGKHIKCPKCGSLLAVGANGSTAAPPEPAAKVEPTLPGTEEVLAQSDLSEQERARLTGELGRDERLLWAGKPSARVAFLRGWIFAGGLWFAALMILVVLIIVMSSGALAGAGAAITLILLLTVIVGLTAAGAAIPYATRWYKQRTAYAATTRRALAWVPDWFGKIKQVTYDAADLVKLYRVDVARSEGGVGNLIFGSFVKRKKTRDGIEERTYIYGFWLVPRAAHVEKLLREHIVDPLLDRLNEE